MQFKKKLVILAIYCFILLSVSQGICYQFAIDVITYNVTIEPDINERSISGTATIDFLLDKKANTVVLNSGNLQIDQVVGKNVVGFNKKGANLIIELSERADQKNKVTISYHGNPDSGLLFNPELGQAYTVYFTSQWMICNDSPGDKAKLNLNLLIPSNIDCIASGVLVNKVQKEEKMLFSWQQDYESPAYTYGFVIGDFNQTQ